MPRWDWVDQVSYEHAQEAATNTININEFDAETVKRMVMFMYEEDYDDNVEVRGLESVFEPENAEVGIANQSKGQSSIGAELN